MKKTFFGLILLGHAFACQAENLMEVFSLAQINDPILQSQKASQLASLEAKPQAASQFLPNLAASSTHYSTQTTYGTPPPNLSSSKIHYRQDTYAITLNQPIFYYEQWINYEKASKEVSAANAQYAAAEQDLIVRCIRTYFNVLKAYDALKFAKARRKAFSKFLEQTQQRFNVGLIAITDVQVAQAQHDNAYAQEISAENFLQNQKEVLRQMVGIDIQKYSFLKGAIKFNPPTPADPENWVKTALDHNLSLKSLSYQSQAAKSNIKLKNSGHMPSLNINGSVARSTNIPMTPRNTNASVGIQVNVPLFSGGMVLSQTRQARHLYEKSQKDFDTLQRSIESQTRQSYRNMLTQLSQIKALKQAITSNTSALKATEASFNVGTRTIVDVLNAQSSLIEAEKNFADARYNYILSSVELKQAAGILSPEDVLIINGWLLAQKPLP